MYLPESFKVEDTATIHAAIRRSGLSTLVTHGSRGLQVSHIPLFLCGDEGEFGTLYGHLARANDQWRDAADGDALAMFLGPDAYITPTWYPTKARTGEVVPTWNYIAIHAYGPLSFFDDPVELLRIVTQLTDRQEQSRPLPWKVSEAPPEYLAKQLRAIVGFRLRIRDLQGKWKLSQNRTVEDQEGVLAGLRAENPAAAAAMEPFVEGRGPGSSGTL